MQSIMHRIKRMQTLCAPRADTLSSTSAHQSNPPHPLLGLSGHHRTLRTATTSQQHRACMCRKPFSTHMWPCHGAVAESAELAEHCGHGHRSAVPLSPLCGLCSGGGSEFIEAELDSGVFVKKGYSDAIVERITRWIDDNATLPDRPGDKSQK